mgnify:FL=1
MSIKILPIMDICKLVCHTLGMARFSVKTEASERLQDIFTKNVRVRMALYDIKQGTLAEALHLTQATLSTKLNRRVEWTVADIANAAVFFKEPVENLVSDSAIEAISGGSEYQLPHYAATDISRRELAAPSGVRYFRRPDDTDRQGGADARPRFFVMPETNQLALRAPEC